MRGLAAALCALLLALVPVFGEETFAGEGGVINLPAAAVHGQNQSLALLASGAPTRPPLLRVTQSVTQPMAMALPPSMRPAVVWISQPGGGWFAAPVSNGVLVLDPGTLQVLMSAGVTRLHLLFIGPSQLTLYATLDFDRQLLNVTLTVP